MLAGLDVLLFWLFLVGRLNKPHSVSQVPTTQLAKRSIDPKFVELTADVLEILVLKFV